MGEEGIGALVVKKTRWEWRMGLGDAHCTESRLENSAGLFCFDSLSPSEEDKTRGGFYVSFENYIYFPDFSIYMIEFSKMLVVTAYSP